MANFTSSMARSCMWSFFKYCWQRWTKNIYNENNMRDNTPTVTLSWRPHLVFPWHILVIIKWFIASGWGADPARWTGDSCGILPTIRIESNRLLLSSLYRQVQRSSLLSDHFKRRRQIKLDTKGLCGVWTEKSVYWKWNTLRLQLAQYSIERSEFLWRRTLFARCESVGETDVTNCSSSKEDRFGRIKIFILLKAIHSFIPGWLFNMCGCLFHFWHNIKKNNTYKHPYARKFSWKLGLCLMSVYSWQKNLPSLVSIVWEMLSISFSFGHVTSPVGLVFSR